MMRTVLASLFAAFVATPLLAQPANPRGCADLARLTLPNTTITLAQPIDAGAFVPPAATPPAAPGPAGAPAAPAVPAIYRELPPFCRVAATLRPSSDSDIKIEVWLPATEWNGKFQAVGNGGWAGTISYGGDRGLAAAVRRGYAAASTDTGHAGNGADASFALNHREKLIDFGHRAVHEMAVQAKAIIAAYYGNAPRLSYWNGCSTGGRQGLMEAQRYPADFDGIVAGAPANYMTRLLAHSLWVAHATLKDPASYIPREKYAVLHTAVLEACDARDGAKDGILEDPARCTFDPKVLECDAADAPTCLTRAQVEAAQKIYATAKNPRTGEKIFPGLAPGSELGWFPLAGGPNAFPIADSNFKYVVFKNPDWDFKTFDFDRDITLGEKAFDGAIDATDPNLNPFFSRGGKLLMYHGWTDQLIPPGNSIDYYTSVVRELGGPDKVSDSIRLFLAPGMSHCGGGEGPNTFDAIAALETWVEKQSPPKRIEASRLTKGVVDRRRPLCPYPAVAEYQGSGSTDDASSFECRVK
jgi:Tannase and feruloyl esterase